MEDKEIIEGLMLMLKDENINITKLVKRIGYKKYQKFNRAFNYAFDMVNS